METKYYQGVYKNRQDGTETPLTKVREVPTTPVVADTGTVGLLIEPDVRPINCGDRISIPGVGEYEVAPALFSGVHGDNCQGEKPFYRYLGVLWETSCFKYEPVPPTDNPNDEIWKNQKIVFAKKISE